ncbi:unnamed protein product [Ilex paraguariensis]|uniref:AT-rich interactive domain-containing protein 5 n=1 Tax=Ilex paraguariensis TaxID=185542 RepID=A0ABC8UD66_9AQUA
MDKSDVDMDDVEKEPRDSVTDGRDSETNLVDAKVERKQEELLPDPHATEDQNPCEERTDDQNNVKKGTEGQSPPKKGVEDQYCSENAEEEKNTSENGVLPVDDVPASGKEELVDDLKVSDNKTTAVVVATDGVEETPEEEVPEHNLPKEEIPNSKNEGDDTPLASQHELSTPNFLVRCSTAKAEAPSADTFKNGVFEDDDGTPEDQAAFMKELECFYRERSMEFKPPRFYGHPLNCLKLWRAVIRLGGYDRVTGSKLWRLVGESFHPPKTCTTVSWTFRIFYEKALLEYERHKSQSGELQLPIAALPESSVVENEALLEYERHKSQSGELQLPIAALPESSVVENEANGYQAPGSGRARRDAAARAMQGWHAQRLIGFGEDKNLNQMPKREKNLKSIGSLKHKRPSEVEHTVKAARTETSKQLVASVVDVGPPADWVKINVRQTKDCFEVYALVPGLLREEVRVQSDPAGRLVITGQPEQLDNPWGITAFKKVVSLPARIDPLQTSAVVSLHGRLFVRVPFEQSNI